MKTKNVEFNSKEDYKIISKITGLKINHIKQVLKGNRKATIKDYVKIKSAIKELTEDFINYLNKNN